MRGNTIRISLGRGRTGQTGKLFQYDRGQRLIIEGIDLPETYQVHWSNDPAAQSKPTLGDGTGVDIPDEYLETGKDIHLWVYVVGEDHAETEFHGIVHVTPRSAPSDIEPTPAQKTVIDQTLEALNSAVESVPGAINDALEEAKESGEFDGPPGEKGDRGEKGETGAPGYTPVKGVDYFDGQDGSPGKDGADGYSPTVTVTDIQGGHRVTITDAEGSHVFNVMDGQGGGGGTSDYSELTNKPKIGGVTLDGNKSLHEIGAAAENDVPKKVSELTNDSGFLTAETDPTVPAWAKEQTKPTYTAAETGAIAAPASPATGAFLVYNGSAWVAQTMSTWQGGSY